ncbi:unnamed protein product [Notodromas monacha]|uniref:Telomeric repeat-binding factor 2-interacting protein 1 n=1 Tax=Notodromas monacha TaxID=399045 RepID=A0A7R9BKY3_9CRUS|nr:unnamed protein product [Notodromas monacha]CAG0916610.1 unnamed protein product [Notodromas monacha]
MTTGSSSFFDPYCDILIFGVKEGAPGAPKILDFPKEKVTRSTTWKEILELEQARVVYPSGEPPAEPSKPRKRCKRVSNACPDERATKCARLIIKDCKKSSQVELAAMIEAFDDDLPDPPLHEPRAEGFTKVDDRMAVAKCKTRIPYTNKDDVKIIDAVIDLSSQYSTGGNTLWQVMEKQQFLPGRTFHSLRNRFFKSILCMESGKFLEWFSSKDLRKIGFTD